MELKKDNINFESDSWHEQMFKNGLADILELSKTTSCNLLFSNYLMKIQTFFENLYHEGKLKDGTIIQDVQRLNLVLGVKAFGKKNDTYEQALKIGAIVELLFQKGLPRKHCIPAVAEWLEIKERTVRSYNEIYRNEYGTETITALKISIIDTQVFFGATRLEPIISIKKTFEEKPGFPYKHPSSKRAFEACIKVIREDPLATIQARLK